MLLVDDDESFCAALSRALERHGLTVRVAHDCGSALATAAQSPMDGAIIDLRIGAESGLRLIAMLLDSYPDLTVLVLTGYASITTAVEAIKLGAAEYLAKPASSTQIIKALKLTPDTGDASIAAQPMSLRRLEWEHLQRVLHDHQGNVSAAARALGMHRRTLQRKLAKHPTSH